MGTNKFWFRQQGRLPGAQNTRSRATAEHRESHAIARKAMTNRPWRREKCGATSWECECSNQLMCRGVAYCWYHGSYMDLWLLFVGITQTPEASGSMNRSHKAQCQS